MAQISVNQGFTISILAAKLELGSTQTLAHREGDTWVLNDPLPDPALELLKCRKEFIALPLHGRQVLVSGGEGVLSVEYPTIMKVKPTLSFSEPIKMGVSGKSYTQSEIDFSDYGGKDHAVIFMRGFTETVPAGVYYIDNNVILYGDART